MMKAGSGKFTDIQIDKEKKFKRLTKFIKVQSGLSQVADQNLNYNLTMFQKEIDFLRYIRMAQRSPAMQHVFSKMLEYIYTDTLIYIPIIEGLNITAKQAIRYEDPNYEFPDKDMIKPIIKKALKK
jgi:hypothetical protein